MIPLEKQVCSLELAKRLKELGVKQESLFYYAIYKRKLNPVYRNQLILDGVSLEGLLSAFTVAELGGMLPPDTDSGKTKQGDFICYTCDDEDGGTWHYENAEKIGKEFDSHGEANANEANARAKMLIHLLENKLIKVPK